MKVLFTILAAFICSLLFSQDTLNIKYFKQLKSIVANDTGIIKMKFVQEKYFNGQIKSQCLYVKLKSDPKKRYWKVGMDFSFHKNGQLKSTDNFDLKTKIMIDTSYVYNNVGEIICKASLNEGGQKKSPTKIIVNFKYIFFKYWQLIPNKFKIFLFNNGRKTAEIPFEDFETTGSVRHGDVIYYKENGTVEKIIRYEKGKEIK